MDTDRIDLFSQSQHRSVVGFKNMISQGLLNLASDPIPSTNPASPFFKRGSANNKKRSEEWKVNRNRKYTFRACKYCLDSIWVDSWNYMSWIFGHKDISILLTYCNSHRTIKFYFISIVSCQIKIKKGRGGEEKEKVGRRFDDIFFSSLPFTTVVTTPSSLILLILPFLQSAASMFPLESMHICRMPLNLASLPTPSLWKGKKE